ncbi:reverse transcriptase [Penicillium argentinense]|uniref:Reverse transcriptase n=1 Tax=Penicillium argentinense TaxID=1131581 RepID=A0A9W9EJQ3_9EURO|nr:reverse transcriptase [Penicillium argentinense]KAJ5083103.1 reverse transcriptase [Penicillium argentinense]
MTLTLPMALRWAAMSGATFKANKTQYIHFTRSTIRNPQPAQPLKVDKQKIGPSNAVKLLGVICDQKLKFRERIGRVTKRGIQASQALMRLKGLRRRNARQLYQSLVVSTITYAASVWATVNKQGNIPEWIVNPMDVIQKRPQRLLLVCFAQYQDQSRKQRSGFSATGSVATAIILDEAQLDKPGRFETPKIHVYTYGSARNGLAGFGLAGMMGNAIPQSTSRTIETHENTDLHNVQLGATSELQAMLPAVTGCMGIRIYATNPSVLQSIINPWVQGGQQIIRHIIQLVRELLEDQVDVRIGRVGSEQDNTGTSMAKVAAQHATQKSSPPNQLLPPDWATQRVHSAIWRKTRRNLRQAHSQQFWQDPFGKHTEAIDAALPGKHTKDMYDQLHRAKADDTCECQEGPETINHFLFDCNLWGPHRGEMRATMGNRYRDTFFALGIGGHQAKDQPDKNLIPKTTGLPIWRLSNLSSNSPWQPTD